MTQEEILEGNKLIAQFMGCYHVDDDKEAYPNGYWMHDEGDYPYDISDYDYHSDWNWLMPVVEKIESLGMGYVMSENNKCEIVITLDNQGKKHFSNRYVGNSKLEAVYCSVVEFIKWYNKNK